MSDLDAMYGARLDGLMTYSSVPSTSQMKEVREGTREPIRKKNSPKTAGGPKREMTTVPSPRCVVFSTRMQPRAI